MDAAIKARKLMTFYIDVGTCKSIYVVVIMAVVNEYAFCNNY